MFIFILQIWLWNKSCCISVVASHHGNLISACFREGEKTQSIYNVWNDFYFIQTFQKDYSNRTRLECETHPLFNKPVARQRWIQCKCVKFSVCTQKCCFDWQLLLFRHAYRVSERHRRFHSLLCIRFISIHRSAVSIRSGLLLGGNSEEILLAFGGERVVSHIVFFKETVLRPLKVVQNMD